MSAQAPVLLPTDELDDDALIARVDRGGDEAATALADLQRRYAKRINHCVQTIVHDPQLAQEVTYETFAKVFLKSHLYRPGSNFAAWLFEVARNHARSKLRDRRRSPLPISNLTASGRFTEQHDLLQLVPDQREHREAEEHEFMRAFEAAVQGLPERYREVFELCVRDGRPYKDAARQLHLPTGTVAIRILRARKRLFQELAPHFDRIRRPPACLN